MGEVEGGGVGVGEGGGVGVGEGGGVGVGEGTGVGVGEGGGPEIVILAPWRREQLITSLPVEYSDILESVVEPGLHTKLKLAVPPARA